MSKRMFVQISILIVGMFIGAIFQPLSWIPASAQGDCRAFPETGKQVCGRFLQYWNGAGGLAQQGLPISNEFTEVSDLNGQSYTVQYFERAVFEKHPENAAPYDVLLSQLGTFQFKRKYPSGEPGGTTPPAPAPTATTPPASSGTPKVEVLDYRVYTNSIGGEYIVGQAKNTSNADAGSVKISGTFKDASGKIVGTSDDSCSCILRGGDIFPFVLTNSSSSPDFVAIDFQTTAQTPSSFEKNYYYSDFTASEINAVPASRGVRILGKITNTGASASSLITVVVLVTDANGKTLDVGDDFITNAQTAPGQSATFDADLSYTTETPNVRVFAYSTKK